MGAWGYGLLSNDTSSDVVDFYKEKLVQGCSNAEATAAVLAQWHSNVSDPEAAPDVVLALAATQLELGRLEEGTRQLAISAIDHPSALDLWRDTTELSRRTVLLSNFRQKLVGVDVAAQKPKNARPKKAFTPICPWVSGDGFIYSTVSGRYLIFVVLEVKTELNGSTTPVIGLLEHFASTKEEAQTVAFAQNHEVIWCGNPMETPRRRIPLERITSLQQKINVAVQPRVSSSTVMLAWKYFDSYLADRFKV